LTTTLLVQFEDTAVSDGDGDPHVGSLFAVGMDCDIRHDANYAYGGTPSGASPVDSLPRPDAGTRYATN